MSCISRSQPCFIPSRAHMRAASLACQSVDCLSPPSQFPLDSPKIRYVPTGSQIARVRKRASLGAEVEVRGEGSWRMTRSDRGEPMEHFCFRLIAYVFRFCKLTYDEKCHHIEEHIEGGRGGRGAGCTQPKEQPAVQTANPTAPVTQADLTAMEQRYKDMLRDVLAQFQAAQQTPIAPPQAPVASQIVPDQLSIEAKHLRDFRKYNPKTFDGSMDNPTKAQMWLTSIETIFRLE
ncbi:histone H2B.3-like [Cucumis melo var. makuwa]|uniref:Histone H2B.3-like n=1 Tax=Cucumis melo var. makuwa TaxID=1194695 RepID=A0A5A7VP01_CUCMM|nr:histone H2B.3-like [Cucumis melo var. makuwa]TYJ96808.1 histone H2B.3-like [Cucumis melo var. makuwa]